MPGSCALVIGGGPAGGVLATHLARSGRRVILAERSSGPHDKVCGEFLAKRPRAPSNEMDIDLAALGAAEISGVRLHERGRSVAVELPFRAYCLSRRILDEAVLGAALSSGAEVRRGVHIKSLARSGSKWLARTAGGDALFADGVFLATGKHDLRGWRRPPSRNDLIGLKLHLGLADDQAAKLKSHVELFVFPGGYAGLTLIENSLANLCLVVTRRMFVRIGGWDRLFANLCDIPALGGAPRGVSADGRSAARDFSNSLWSCAIRQRGNLAIGRSSGGHTVLLRRGDCDRAAVGASRRSILHRWKIA